MTTNLATDRSDPLIGTRIDNRYLVQRVLGRGGMGVVYAGLHEHLEREVAIKVLGPGIANEPVAVQRFLREARTASRLTHGNIVDVSDLGTLPDGRPYLVMARLHGEDLCALLQRCGPQTPQRTVELLRGAAAALDLIHAKGYLHRDVKPENLMHVVREDGSEAVLLLDFGIVGLVSPDNARLTAAGAVFGTPIYIAPEVIRGGAPSAVSDVYALATVAFELMTGLPPFTSANVFDLLQSKMMHAAPCMQDVAGFELPASIEQVIATALEREPALRQTSAGAFVSALDAAVKAVSPAQLQRMAAVLEQITYTRARPPTGTVDRLITESLLPAALSRDTEQRPPLVEPGPTAPLTPVAVSVTPRSPPQPPAATHVLVAPRSVDRHWLKLVVGFGVVLLLAIVVRAAWQDRRARIPESRLNRPRNEPELAAPDTGGPQPSAAAAAATVPTPTNPVSPPAPAAPAAPTPVVEPPPARATRLPRRPHQAAAAQTSAGKPPTSTAQADDARRLGANALVQQAQAELVKGHLSSATDLYQRATQLDPRSAAAFRGLGLVEERLGHTAEAVRALRRALILAPHESTNPLLEQRVRKLEGARP